MYLLRCYFSKLPKAAYERDIFYWRPRDCTPVDVVAQGFEERVMGKGKFGSMVKTMCAKAGITGNKTNHSLKATGATRMFESNVPEKIIQERTGHRSVEALRTYQRTSLQQQKAVSCLLAAPCKLLWQMTFVLISKPVFDSIIKVTLVSSMISQALYLRYSACDLMYTMRS